MTLYLRTIPVNVSRWELLTEIKTTPGFVSLSLSEPLKNQNFVRYGWITYDSQENCNASKQILDSISIHDFYLSPVKSQSQRKPIRVNQLVERDR